MFESELCERFGIPETHGVVAPIPIGYPLGRFGPVRRRPRVACRRGACQGASKRPETDRRAFTRSEQSKEKLVRLARLNRKRLKRRLSVKEQRELEHLRTVMPSSPNTTAPVRPHS